MLTMFAAAGSEAGGGPLPPPRPAAVGVRPPAGPRPAAIEVFPKSNVIQINWIMHVSAAQVSRGMAACSLLLWRTGAAAAAECYAAAPARSTVAHSTHLTACMYTFAS